LQDDLAQRLIGIARPPCSDDPLGKELKSLMGGDGLRARFDHDRPLLSLFV